MPEIRHQPRVTTTVAAHAAGDTIDRHRHDEHQLVHVSSGLVAITTARGAWVVSPDRAIWIPAGTWHEHRFYGRSTFHSVGFPVSTRPFPGDQPTVVSAAGLVGELVIACTERGVTASERRRVRAVLLDRLRRVPVAPLAVPRAQDVRLARACELVVQDLAQPRALPWLAHAVGTSDRTLSRLFREEFGVTYPQWRTQARVFEAAIRLADGKSITDTAHRCGWSTPSAFIDAFVRTMGQTPGHYRAAAGRLPG